MKSIRYVLCAMYLAYMAVHAPYAWLEVLLYTGSVSFFCWVAIVSDR